MSTESAISEIKHFFFDDNLIKAIRMSVHETLNEMCRLHCDFESGFVAQSWSALGQASGSIELVSGQQRGRLQFHLTEAAALNVMSKLLGRSPMQINEEVLDCVGALTGIIYGRMKTLLNTQGYKFNMATPTMNYTDKLNHSEGIISHLIIPFRVSQSKCYVQVLLYA